MDLDEIGTGINYGTLARLQKPEIPGMAARTQTGLSGMAGAAYGAQNARYQQALKGMQPMADLDMQLKQRAAEEAFAEMGSRRKERELKGIKLQTEMDDFNSPEAKITRIAERIAKLDKAKKDSLLAKSHIFSAVAGASPDEVPMLLEQFGEEASYNGKSLKQMPPQVAITFSRGIIQGLKDSPSHLGKVELQDSKLKAQREKEERTAKTKETVERIRAKAKTDAAAIAAQGSATAARIRSNPKTLEAHIQRQIEEATADGASLTDAIEAVQPLLEQVKEIKKAGRAPPAAGSGLAALLGSNQPSATQSADLFDTNTKAGVDPRQLKQPMNLSPKKFENGKTYKDANGNMARYNNGKWELVK